MSNNAKKPEEWEKLPRPDLNWDRYQRVLNQHLANVEANIRSAALQGNGQLVLAFTGVLAQLITALGVCEFNRPKNVGELFPSA